MLVNSAFTASVYEDVFCVLRASRAFSGAPPPSVLHPAIDLQRNRALAPPPLPSDRAPPPVVLVSINRFERKKALELAVIAWPLALPTPGSSPQSRPRLRPRNKKAGIPI